LKSAIWHPYTTGISGSEIFVERAEGSWIYTRDGRKILDAISSWWVNLHGHAHPHIANAIGNQAQKLEQVIFAGFTHEPAVELARRLLPILPGAMSRLFFSDNGSTAVEVAMKLALQHFNLKGKRRTKIVALDNGYHGDTFGTMAVGARGPFSQAFTDWLKDVEFVTPQYEISIDVPLSESGNLELKKAESIFERGDVAALVVEPLLQGAGGMLIYSQEWLNRLFFLARKYGVLIIADEVFTGFFRTGKPFACFYLDQQPDLICLSKGLTAGFLPMGITVCSENVAEPFLEEIGNHTFYHGHSFTANPLSCAAALASLDLTEMPEFANTVQRISSKQQGFASKINSLHPDLNARSLGSVSALTLQSGSGVQYHHPLRNQIYKYFLERGLLLRPLGNVIYSVPPFSTSEDEMDLIAEEVLRYLEKINQG